MTIRETIQAELKRRGWSRYQLARTLKEVIPESTLYEYLRGDTDLGTERASIILQALGLQIIRKLERGKRPRKET
jgi:ribosome-binding protein aMBF1 (putative translation factor)